MPFLTVTNKPFQIVENVSVQHCQGGENVLLYRQLENSNDPGLTLGGYFCPQCRAKYCELPVECKVCGE